MRKFIGREALEKQLTNNAIKRKLVGLVLQENSVIATGQAVTTAGGDGIITSGCFSPSLNQSRAIAWVPMGATSSVTVNVRGSTIAARLCELPFVNYGAVLAGAYYVSHSD
jgi:aminomethyltransferase